jgi:RNA polymerase sigma factor (sigma-70 family)
MGRLVSMASRPTPPRDTLAADVRAAQAGDLRAYERVVRATEAMVLAVCRARLRHASDARDAVQEAFLRAHRGLSRLDAPEAFPGYLRRTAERVVSDLKRARRVSFAPFDDLSDAFLADRAAEPLYSDERHAALARALLTLPADARLLTHRIYYGGASVARLAAEARVSEPAMRKRLQRIRDQLREEITMSEHPSSPPAAHDDLPARVVELLARPTLVALPDNPVARIVAALSAHFAAYSRVELAELVELDAARAELETDPVYVPSDALLHADARRILRYDLTLRLLLAARGRGAPLRLWAAGKVYRNEQESATRLSAFHQFELLWLDDRDAVEPWAFVGELLSVLDGLVPGASHRVTRTSYPFCSEAWDLGVEVGGEYSELLGCGVYRADVVRMLGGDPARQRAVGCGLGLERLAALHYTIADIRPLERARLPG